MSGAIHNLTNHGFSPIWQLIENFTSPFNWAGNREVRHYDSSDLTMYTSEEETNYFTTKKVISTLFKIAVYCAGFFAYAFAGFALLNPFHLLLPAALVLRTILRNRYNYRPYDEFEARRTAPSQEIPQEREPEPEVIESDRFSFSEIPSSIFSTAGGLQSNRVRQAWDHLHTVQQETTNTIQNLERESKERSIKHAKDEIIRIKTEIETSRKKFEDSIKARASNNPEFEEFFSNILKQRNDNASHTESCLLELTRTACGQEAWNIALTQLDEETQEWVSSILEEAPTQVVS